jgi:hypothetical protein
VQRCILLRPLPFLQVQCRSGHSWKLVLEKSSQAQIMVVEMQAGDHDRRLVRSPSTQSRKDENPSGWFQC